MKNIKVIEINESSMFLLGGAMATINQQWAIDQREENLKSLPEEQREEVTKIYKEVFELKLDEEAILIHPKLKEILSANELRGVMLHEEGHIHHGHLKRINDSDVNVISIEGGAKIIDEVIFEIEADLHAMKVVGPRVLKSALKKIIKAVSEVSGTPEWILNAGMKERFDAIDAFRRSNK